ncbi:MAG: hypothetical protein IJ723_07670 [Ruminococcus sp.]|nr:hypothetical protein [Ruminococcus sp.]
MDKFFKAIIAGFLIAVLAAAVVPGGDTDASASAEVFLFPQLSISAASDRTPTGSGQKNSDSPEVVYAFKLSEILDSLAERHHSI